MGCITVSAERIGGITAEAERVGGINAYAERLGGITVTVALICSVAQGKYLRVTPEETQWVTIDNPVMYNVLTNLDWTLT